MSENFPHMGALKSPAILSKEKRSEASTISMPRPMTKYSLAKTSVPRCPRMYMKAVAIKRIAGPYFFRFLIRILPFCCSVLLSNCCSGLRENHNIAARTRPGMAKKIRAGHHVKFRTSTPVIKGPMIEPRAPPV